MKIFQVFESYPLFYQPYIPPTLDVLSKQKDLISKIIAFQGQKDQNGIEILPSYYKRVAREFYFNTTNNYDKKFNLLEIKSIKEKVDIIHIQHSFLFNKVISILELPKESRPKIIITLRGGDTYIKPWISKRWKDFYKNYGENVDAFVVMSEDQKKYLTRWDVPSENIHVIPISFGHKFKATAKTPNEETMKIVSVFRMCWEKNIADNLKLIKQIKASGINIQYDVYGDGKDIGQLYYLLDRYNLNDSVNVKGKVENEILKNKLKEYDFILQLSHSESFGMSVVEAQTHGVPAIVSLADGLNESVLDEKTGFVFERDFSFTKEAHRIIELWKDKNRYLEMSQNAIDFSQSSFNVDVEVSKLLKLYSSLIN